MFEGVSCGGSGQWASVLVCSFVIHVGGEDGKRSCGGSRHSPIALAYGPKTCGGTGHIPISLTYT